MYILLKHSKHMDNERWVSITKYRSNALSAHKNILDVGCKVKKLVFQIDSKESSNFPSQMCE